MAETKPSRQQARQKAFISGLRKSMQHTNYERTRRRICKDLNWLNYGWYDPEKPIPKIPISPNGMAKQRVFVFFVVGYIFILIWLWSG